MIRKKLPVMVFAVIYATGLFAQSLPVGSLLLEDYFRRSQLTSGLDSTISFTIRPLNTLGNLSFNQITYPDSLNRQPNFLKVPALSDLDKGEGIFQLLPAGMRMRINTHHPYGWNDGAMIPAKGLQTMFSAGVYAKYGHLSIQLKPEVVLASNDVFEGFPEDHYEVIWARYYDFNNYTDLPERFGTEPYSRAFWGQSSVRLNFDPVSVGLSSENLWWGPGKRNSLLMSNNAPGFNHFTLNTSRPVNTPAGSFEGQLVAGRLEGSGFTPLTPDREYFGSPLLLAKPNDWRYLSGLALTWQPKWVPGLFLGLTRSFQVYNSDRGKGIGSYLPLFSVTEKVESDQSFATRDEYSSLFMRWVWFEEQAEIYFEYGRNNHNRTLRNTVLEPENSRAYLCGLSKLFPLSEPARQSIELNVEVTQLQQTSVQTVLNAGSWYLNKNIRHGYTNRGETLGAGIGPGSNLQSVSLSWLNGLNKFGFMAERLVHNNDFYYYAYVDSQDWRRHWVDFSLSGNAAWSYKNFLFQARATAIQSLNYQWYLLQDPGEPYFVNGRDRFNLSIETGFTYRF